MSVLGTEELSERPSFAESKFAREFLPRFDLSRALVLHLKPATDEPEAGISMFRTSGENEFSDREKAFLRHSGPVLAHSFHCALEAETAIPQRDGHLAVLTDREYEIARLASLGFRNEQIAEQLNIAPGTVKTHLHNVYSKLDVDSRVHLAMRLAGH